MYSSDSTQEELTNKYQHDRVSVLVLWTEVALALEELIPEPTVALAAESESVVVVG